MNRARVLLLTGKGGVGKTTTAAATALACAEAGHRTLVLSTDPAHSLADALDEPLGDRPRHLGGRLWGQQLDAQARLEASWGEIRSWLLEVLAWSGVRSVEAEELAVVPGLDELFALTDLVELAGSGRWDVVVVDCAPTAETLRLLSLPEVLGWYMERLFPVGRRLNRVVAPMLGRLTNLPVAGDDVFVATERFHHQLTAVRQLLADPDATSVRLVVNPERIVVAEARRTHTYLSLFGYRVDAVVANRLLPGAVTDPWFRHWRELQAEQLQVIEEGFAPVPVLRSELAEREVVGAEALRAFAAALYGDLDPAAHLHEGDPLSLDTEGDRTVLRLPLPFAEHEQVDVGRTPEELLITVGPYRRAVVLPGSLQHRPVVGARLADGVLHVTFGVGQDGPP